MVVFYGQNCKKKISFSFLSYPSVIKSSPTRRVVLEGSNVTLHCNVTGNPPSNITWTKDGSPTVLHQGESLIMVIKEPIVMNQVRLTSFKKRFLFSSSFLFPELIFKSAMYFFLSWWGGGIRS